MKYATTGAYEKVVLMTFCYVAHPKCTVCQIFFLLEDRGLGAWYWKSRCDCLNPLSRKR